MSSFSVRLVAPSAARKVGLLVREFFIDTKLYEPQPYAQGLRPMWELHKMRHEGGA